MGTGSFHCTSDLLALPYFSPVSFYTPLPITISARRENIFKNRKRQKKEERKNKKKEIKKIKEKYKRLEKDRRRREYDDDERKQ